MGPTAQAALCLGSELRAASPAPAATQTKTTDFSGRILFLECSACCFAQPPLFPPGEVSVLRCSITGVGSSAWDSDFATAMKARRAWDSPKKPSSCRDWSPGAEPQPHAALLLSAAQSHPGAAACCIDNWTVGQGWEVEKCFCPGEGCGCCLLGTGCLPCSLPASSVSNLALRGHEALQCCEECRVEARSCCSLLLFLSGVIDIWSVDLPWEGEYEW